MRLFLAGFFAALALVAFVAATVLAIHLRRQRSHPSNQSRKPTLFAVPKRKKEKTGTDEDAS
jgi:hypothetical protein